MLADLRGTVKEYECVCVCVYRCLIRASILGYEGETRVNLTDILKYFITFFHISLICWW